VTLLKFLPALAVLTLIVGVVRISLMFRARAMGALAARWGLHYIGPPRFQMVGVPPFAQDQAPCSRSVFASLVAGKQN
jgi:hypothetical protein